MTKGCQALEASLSETAGKYCVGDSVSLADLSLAPQCNAFERYKIDMSSFPKIVEINRRLNELEAFKKAHGYRQIDTPADLKLDWEFDIWTLHGFFKMILIDNKKMVFFTLI